MIVSGLEKCIVIEIDKFIVYIYKYIYIYYLKVARRQTTFN